ncbi:hypothetical protein CKAH01_04897 [Colletotrichum kahawae]|uniref:Uncharacterized protein n=1 Tax=Colletotrichum kahawae TaxID=34407 RepID=A0AAD9YIV6_COLKA|nr:hypothetical protein CKAH01_04897 [Colletotrichum kahawae]
MVMVILHQSDVRTPGITAANDHHPAQQKNTTPGKARVRPMSSLGGAVAVVAPRQERVLNVMPDVPQIFSLHPRARGRGPAKGDAQPVVSHRAQLAPSRSLTDTGIWATEDLLTHTLLLQQAWQTQRLGGPREPCSVPRQPDLWTTRQMLRK